MESQIVNYQGSRTFQYLSDISNFPIDQVNYLLAQVAALGLAFFFKNFLCHEAISTNTRHMFSMICGIFLAYFCFGYQVYHMFIQASLAYIIVKSTSPVESHRFVMLFAFMYLSAMHLMRQFYTYGLYTLDITGPMMILTQKVSAFAFNVHDGVATPPEKLTVDQKRLAIRRMPELLEYFSYIFSFQAILSGPLIPYAEFVDYMNGSFYNKASKNNNYSALKERRFNEYSWCDVPSPNQVVAYKLITSLSFLCSVYFVQMVWPATFITSDEFLDQSLWWIMGYLIIHTTTLRFKYYLGWLLSDAICNASGFGFNGYDCNNKPLWNGVSNVDVIGFEFGENMRGCLLSWNTTTQLWLKRYAYERVTNKKYKTLYTFLLSALWHGFYPGYYLMFLTAAVFTECARIVRRHVRPLFQSYSASSRLYDVTTIVTTRIFMSYMTFPFDVLHFVPSIRIYMRLYFCLHLLAVVAYLALPVLLPLKYRSVSKSSNQPVAANDNFVDRENKSNHG
ncbi:MBOAT1 (predicted) [Pycnogonum litorale]